MTEEIKRDDLDVLKIYLVDEFDRKIEKIEHQIGNISKLIQELNKNIERTSFEANFNISDTHLKIIDFFLENPTKKFRAVEIADKIDISRAHVFNLLGNLYEASLVLKNRKDGKVVYNINEIRANNILSDRIKKPKDKNTKAEESLRLAKVHYAEGD